MIKVTEDPFISIVVPARNEEEHIERLLNSVQKSEYEDYEVVIVDGGSTDNTKKVAESYGARVIDGPQKGTAVARNVGWQNARGEAIYFLDADWFLGEGTLKAVAEAFEEGADYVAPNHDHYADNWVSKAVSAENKFGYKSDRARKIKSLFQSIKRRLPW